MIAADEVLFTPLLPTETATGCALTFCKLSVPPLVKPPNVADVCVPKEKMPMPLVSKVLSCSALTLPTTSEAPLTSVAPVKVFAPPKVVLASRCRSS